MKNENVGHTQNTDVTTIQFRTKVQAERTSTEAVILGEEDIS